MEAGPSKRGAKQGGGPSPRTRSPRTGQPQPRPTTRQKKVTTTLSVPEQAAPLTFHIEKWEDYIPACASLRAQGLLGGQENPCFALLIGCSSHSPIQGEYFQSVVDIIAQKVLSSHKCTILWGGGDPVFSKGPTGVRKRKRGNIADVAKALLEANHIKEVGAVQRQDWLAQVPQFERVKVGYHKRLARIDKKYTFGGFVESPPDEFRTFLSKLRGKKEVKRARIEPQEGSAEAQKREDDPSQNNHQEDKPSQEEQVNCIFLPPENAYPMAASAGYLCLLPVLGNVEELVVIVVMRAGYICLQEVTYVSHLLDYLSHSTESQLPRYTIPVHVYGISWRGVEDDLTQEERSKKCCLEPIRKMIHAMKEKHPDNVHLLHIEEPY
jgi:hypothetical protein